MRSTIMTKAHQQDRRNPRHLIPADPSPCQHSLISSDSRHHRPIPCHRVVLHNQTQIPRSNSRKRRILMFDIGSQIRDYRVHRTCHLPNGVETSPP